jgi:acetate CoA/acetoacetate CoA-transferase alpha subunit
MDNALLDTTNKEVSMEQALEHIKDDMSLMVGGFAGTGSPLGLIQGTVRKQVKNITLIGTDTGFPRQGVGLMVEAGQITKAIVSHVGTNPLTGKLAAEGKMEVELVPQGTLAERIRSGGYGLGGVLTPTGIGTDIEIGKMKIEVDGRLYLLEKPLRADVAIIRCEVADRMGNLICYGTNVAYSLMMAAAADVVIAEAKQIVEIGELDPSRIDVQSIFVDYIVKGEN